MALTAITGSGTQTSTTTPQNSVQPNGLSGGTPASIQPNASNASLNSSGGAIGIPLITTPLTTVHVTPTATASTTKQPVSHHVNPVLFGFSALLFVIAVVLFWQTGRSAKSTTKK